MKHSDCANSRRRTLFTGRRLPFPLLGAVLVAALAATGGAFASEGEYDSRQGWREATVDKTEDAALHGRYFSDCRDKTETGQVVSGRFVVLTYEHMGRTHHRVIPLRRGEAYRLGALVYVNVNSCKAPIVARTGTARK
ncbi:MAG TPA: hypothetical protein VN663_08275 [Ramlibacter sp.]|nr:hypothetical protein [Ramlibacter sp.]